MKVLPVRPFKVPYIDLPAQYRNLESEIMAAVRKVFSTGSFILRDQVAKFEKELAAYLDVKHVIGVNSGTDALFLSLFAAGLKPGDEVITVGHTFIATISAIVHNRATPVLVDIGNDFNMDPDEMNRRINSKTRAVVPVHMNGRMCNMNEIVSAARKHRLIVIEDAAQSLGASFRGQPPGRSSWAACFSLHPMKILGGAGDGGFVATNDGALAEKIRLYRNHGQASKKDIRCFAFNSRLDNLQAAILRAKFASLPRWIERRRSIAGMYAEGLKDLNWMELPSAPMENGASYDVFTSYVVRAQRRDALALHLRKNGVEVFVHWSPPNHKQKGLKLNRFKLPNTEKVSREVLSLPIYPEMTDVQVKWVVETIRNFRESS